MKEILERLVGNPNNNKEEYIKRSPIYWPGDINVPLLIIHGTDDKLVSVDQVRKFTQKLDELNKEFTYVEYPDTNHFLINRLTEIKEKTINFLYEKLNN